MAEEAHALIDWRRTRDVCMTIHCECGEENLFPGYEGASPEHVFCKVCKGVIRIGERVALSETEVDLESRPEEPYVRLHRKGTSLYMQARCSCGLQFSVNGALREEVDCECGKHFYCNPIVSATKLSIEEAAKVNVRPPEEDLSFSELMNPD